MSTQFGDSPYGLLWTIASNTANGLEGSPKFGDSRYVLWYKIASNIGKEPPRWGDSIYTLWYKTASNPRYGDSPYALLFKIATDTGGSPKWGDSWNTLIQKIAGSTAGGGLTPVPKDITFNAIGTKITGTVLNGQLFPITIGNLTDGYVVFTISCWDSRSVDAMTFDGISMTLLAQVQNPASPNAKVWLFGVAVGNKVAGTYNAVLTTGSGLDYSIGSLTSYQGVNQSAPTGVAVTASSATNAVTVNVASAAIERVLGYGYCDSGGGAATVGAGQTARWSHTGPEGSSMYSDEPGAVTVTHSYTFTIASSIVAAVPLKPAMGP